MDEFRYSGDPEKGKFSGNKKYSATPKDVKRKLSCMNKRISDLQHQKKLVYKNSVKVKKMVHNQINQIVKCFRARERNICSDVDEVYLSQDSNITEELSRLQSVYAHCQALFTHIEDFKEKADVLRNIDNVLSEINFSEKLDVKPLEFVSDFEMMKVKANSYGCLEGDFVKKDDFVYVDIEKDNRLSEDNYKLFRKKESQDQNCSAPKNDVISFQKSSLYKTTENDDFQIIDLLDNMSCQDVDDDFIMDEDTSRTGIFQTGNDLNDLLSSKKENPFRIKEYATLKNSSDNKSEANIDFNPEEEWKQILEMNKKLANWHGMASKETVSNCKEKDELYNKNCSPCKFLLLKEANDWLYNSEKKETTEKLTRKVNFTSPAEIIKKSFKSYLTKDNYQNWLSAH